MVLDWVLLWLDRRTRVKAPRCRWELVGLGLLPAPNKATCRLPISVFKREAERAEKGLGIKALSHQT